MEPLGAQGGTGGPQSRFTDAQLEEAFSHQFRIPPPPTIDRRVWLLLRELLKACKLQLHQQDKPGATPEALYHVALCVDHQEKERQTLGCDVTIQASEWVAFRDWVQRYNHTLAVAVVTHRLVTRMIGTTYPDTSILRDSSLVAAVDRRRLSRRRT